MRIALFTETYLPQINGVATHVKTLKDGLEYDGHEVLVVTADPKATRHYVEDGVLRCPALEVKKLYSYGMATFYSSERQQFLMEFHPDIIHIHTEFGIGLFGLIMARKLRVPVVYTLHTMWDEYLHYIAGAMLLPIVRQIAHAYVRFLSKKASVIIGPSRKAQTFLHRCGVFKEAEVIPNSAEQDKFSRDRVDSTRVLELKKMFGISPEDLTVCFCGRLGKEKSVDLLLELFKEQHREGDHIKLMIIGEGPIRSELEQQAQQLGISEDVIFTGSVDHSSMQNYYACCDMYVTASRSENHSISMLEAMSMGLPTLYILDEANEGQIVDGVNGYIFRNSEELYAAMCRYRDSSENEKQILRESVMASVKSSGKEPMIARIVNIYMRVQGKELLAHAIK